MLPTFFESEGLCFQLMLGKITSHHHDMEKVRMASEDIEAVRLEVARS